MGRQELGRTRIQANLIVHTNIYLGEIVTIEIRLQNLSVFNNMLFLQLTFRTIYEPCRIQLLLLTADGLGLLGGFLLQRLARSC